MDNQQEIPRRTYGEVRIHREQQIDPEDDEIRTPAPCICIAGLHISWSCLIILISIRFFFTFELDEIRKCSILVYISIWLALFVFLLIAVKTTLFSCYYCNGPEMTRERTFWKYYSRTCLIDFFLLLGTMLFMSMVVKTKSADNKKCINWDNETFYFFL